MSLGHIDSNLAVRLSLDLISKACRTHGVSRLWAYGSILERQPTDDDEIQFLVDFMNNDFGPWGSKLDLLENDLAGPLHHKVNVVSRAGIIDSTPQPFRDEILNSARLIYES